jgi:transposase
MRYPQGGGLTAERRRFREQIRLQAAERFAHGEMNTHIAKELRVHIRSVERWRQAWRCGGTEALRSTGPASRPKLGIEQFAKLEADLERGPLAHGFTDQRWTLARIKTVIGRMFHVGYTPRGVWGLMRRNGWSWQTPARRAMERDDAAVELWKKEVWPRVERPRRPVAPGSSSRTNPGTR